MRVERLGPSHDISSFSCRVTSLDDWLRNHALENQRRNLSRTFVLLDDGDHVVGYYALTMGGVTRSELPRRWARGVPAIEIGMVLLARLAVDAQHQGEGLGRDLLINAITRAVTAGHQAAARFLAVDPVDDTARAFYRHFGFEDIDGDERGRMFLRIDDALSSFDESTSDN